MSRTNLKNVMITGATGMVGGLVLQECLNSDEIAHVISLVRRPSGLEHEKLEEIIHSDFTDYQAIESRFENIDIAYFCIGVYTGAVPRDEFRKITVDYTKEFSITLKNKSPNATVCFLSGAGADQSEKSRMIFAKDKGVAENFLLSQKFNQLYLFRPAYIYPVTPRQEPNLSYLITRRLYPLLKRIYAKGVITSEELAKAMFQTGMTGGELTILENAEIKKIADKLGKKTIKST